MPTPPKVFISYAHKDTELKQDLVLHLQGLIQRGVISSWHDGLLVAGQPWDTEIVRQLDASRILLLLVSPDSMASEYISSRELERASERHATGHVCIIPVLVRNVDDWQSKPFGAHKLGDFQALPSTFKFIADSENQDAALADVVRGIREAVKKLPDIPDTIDPPVAPPDYEECASHHLPIRPPAIGFAPRRDAQGRDLLEQLIKELDPEKNRLVTLSGMGGVGKTVLAVEVVCAIRKIHPKVRVVWSDVEGRTDYTFTSLLDDIADQLGRRDLMALPDEEKKAAQVHALVAKTQTLIVLDSYEQLQFGAEQGGKESAGEPPPAKEPINELQAIKGWFKHAQCAALFVSREMEMENETVNVFVPHMFPDESLDMIDRLVKQTRENRDRFTPEIRENIYKTAEGIPALIRWIVALIGMGQPAHEVFEDVKRGEGEVPERVFNSSFNLPQVGEDGRATLLALSLFKPSATLQALAVAAGITETRARKALESLFRLDLIEGADEDGRYQVRGLTLSIAAARLPRSKYADDIWRRFVNYFREVALTKYDWTLDETPAHARVEKSNILRAIQVAPCIKDWDTVMELFDLTLEKIHSFGVWREAIKLSEEYAELKIAVKSSACPIIIEIYHKHKADVQTYYESLHRKLTTGKTTGKRWKRIVLSAVKYQLGVFAYDAGDYPLAEQRFREAKELKLDIKDKLGVAISCNNLGVVLGKRLEKEKQAERDYRAEAEENFTQALEYLYKFMNPTLESRPVKAKDKPKESLCTFEESRDSKKQGARFEKVIYLNRKWLDGEK